VTILRTMSVSLAAPLKMPGPLATRCRRFALAFVPLAVATCGGLVGCGARTGLFDSQGPPLDAAIDVSPPAIASDCADSGATLVYLISIDSTLMSFYPPTATFTTIGQIDCPTNPAPFSMAVDHGGTAYVVFDSGELFRVSTATAACEPTPFVVGGFTLGFGMGFSGSSDGTETLYVASAYGQGTKSRLATIDTTTYSLEVVGTFTPSIFAPELTGTGAGDLFAFYTVGSGSAIGQVDKSNAKVTAQWMLPGVPQGSGWAFAIWGGDFYMFTAPSDKTIVTRFRPSDGSVVQVATSPQVIVGAGVSTCAPQ
jgi:hypothetical protein